MPMKPFLTLPLVLCALVFGGTPAAAATFTTNTLIAVGDMSYDGQDIVVSFCVLTVNGDHAFNSLRAVGGGVVTHAGGNTNNRLNLTISQDVYVDATSAIDVSGSGFGTSSGSGGATNSGAGGGYGGVGGSGSGGAGGLAYGSITAPADLGSGGGPGYMSSGGSGGGTIWLTVGGTLRMDGLLAANGVGCPSDFKYGGGGSGGSIYLTAATVSGSGVIRAEGGTGNGQGGGGGGRVAIYADTNNFAGAVSARGGTGSQNGGAGTIFTKLTAQALASLLVDNGSNWGQLTPVSAPVPLQLTLSNCATVYPLSPLTVHSLHLATNTVLTFIQQTGLVLTVLSDAIVDRGGAIDVSGKGFGSSSGPGGATNSGAGGGYGGVGGSSSGGAGGQAYGSITAPVDLGSGGGPGYASSGGSGGGAIWLTVGGTLHVDGLLAANGVGCPTDFKYGGGGSGGSIYLTATTVSGSGAIRAEGGTGGGQSGGGGGGGGRIAIYFDTNIFAGQITAYGGPVTSGPPGGAGTIFTKSSSATRGLVLIDGGGANGITRLNSSFWPQGQVFDLTIAGGARLYPEVPLSFYDLVISSGASVSCDGGLSTGVYLAAFGNLRMDTNTSIDVTGCGYGGSGGTGAGASGAGGGYGGKGGGSGGGAMYGSASEPVDLGSGGGPGYMSGGGSGGGAIHLCVAGAFQLDGILKADGVASGGDYRLGGAGSGGSVYVTSGSLTGAGSISAQGGSGGQGGGGGGRIAVYTTNTYGGSASISAAGGTGGDASRNGQNGTVSIGSVIPALQVSGSSPTGAVTRLVGTIGLAFNSAVAPGSFTADDVVINTPSGQIPQNQIAINAAGGPLFTIVFPLQTNLGQYQVQVGPNITNLYGQPMGSAFLGTFSIQQPAIQGTVRTTNGWPVRGLTVRSLDGLVTATTDTNGNYSLVVAPGWTGTIFPQLVGASFVPANRSYSGLSTNQTGQDYSLAMGVQPLSTIALHGSTLSVSWPTIPGLHYQMKRSEDLKVWEDYDSLQTGTGGPLSVSFDIRSTPHSFFRSVASP